MRRFYLVIEARATGVSMVYSSNHRTVIADIMASYRNDTVFRPVGIWRVKEWKQ